MAEKQLQYSSTL